MRKAESLYLKGSTPSDVRDEALYVNTLRYSSITLGYLSIRYAYQLENADLMAPIVPILGTNHSQLGNKTFPA